MLARLTASACLALLALAGCGSVDARESAAESAARAFGAAVRDDPARACDLLARETRREVERDSAAGAGSEAACAEALADLPAVGTVRDVAVYGRHARVRGTGDTLFLTDAAGRWQVVAAGCRASGEEPYDCTVKGA